MTTEAKIKEKLPLLELGERDAKEKSALGKTRRLRFE